MAKETIFTPEDFKKPKDKSFWQKYRIAILCAAGILIVVIVLCCVFYGKTEDNVEEVIEQESAEQVVTDVDSQVKTETSKGVETETNSEVHTEESKPVPVVEVPKDEVAMTKSIPQSANVSDNIEQEAMNVIRGDYGNIPERREKLGNRYQEIQNRVNELKRQGVF